MKKIEKNGLTILESELGYALHDEENDIYTQKVYLGKNATPDIYKEVKMDAIDGRVASKTVQLEGVTAELEELTEVLMLALDELYQLVEGIFTMIGGVK